MKQIIILIILTVFLSGCAEQEGVSFLDLNRSKDPAIRIGVQKWSTVPYINLDGKNTDFEILEVYNVTIVREFPDRGFVKEYVVEGEEKTIEKKEKGATTTDRSRFAYSPTN